MINRRPNTVSKREIPSLSYVIVKSSRKFIASSIVKVLDVRRNEADIANTHGAGLMDRKMLTLLYLWQHFNFNWTRPKLENKTET